jgi:hypothetical protein
MKHIPILFRGLRHGQVTNEGQRDTERRRLVLGSDNLGGDTLEICSDDEKAVYRDAVHRSNPRKPQVFGLDGGDIKDPFAQRQRRRDSDCSLGMGGSPRYHREMTNGIYDAKITQRPMRV